LVVDGGPREVPELKVREHPPSTLRNVEATTEVEGVDGGLPGGAGGRPDSGHHRS
jgi:hypothetical protein